MELCNKIGQSSVVKIIFKKQLFFKVKLGLKHDNILPKIAKKNYGFPFAIFFRHPLRRMNTGAVWAQENLYVWSFNMMQECVNAKFHENIASRENKKALSPFYHEKKIIFYQKYFLW